jgi:RNA polymerase sigma factor (sigma-70 family)
MFSIMDDKRRRFDAEVLPYLDAAYRFARWLSRSRDDAEDIVHDAMVRAFRGFDGLRGADAKPWLLSIVRNCHATRRQREQRSAWVPLPDEHDAQDGNAMIANTPDPESESIRRDEQRILERLLAKLAPEQREVLVLREIEDMNYRQIAEVTNTPIGTVMSRLARARATLKANWQVELRGETHVMR